MIYGAGGHGKVVAEAAREAGYVVSCFLDDSLSGQSVLGIPVRPRIQDIIQQLLAHEVIIAVGEIAARQRLFTEFVAYKARLATIVHPFSWISPSATLGTGTFIGGGVVINAQSVVGENCIINTSSSIDHDCRIGDHSHICPGVRLAGNVTVGAKTLLGTGASVIPGVKIGDNCVIGAGSVVLRNIPDSSVIYGVPARIPVA
jgi:sugar O-acyltransferase (sialic acid O-acetyltransferase NeuD family)